MADVLVSDALMELIFVALDHGVDSVTEGGPLIPFALLETSDGRDLTRFAAGTLEEGQALAHDHVRAAGADRAAIAYDGYLTVEGNRNDAIFVAAQERGQGDSVVFAQRYRPGGRFKKFTTIGNAAFVDRGESLF